jgi:hypothetical protein
MDPKEATVAEVAVWGPSLCLASGLLHLLLSQLAARQLAARFPSVGSTDLLYAANWSVSLLQATAVTTFGLLGSWYTGFDTLATNLPVLVPFGWVNLGYWIYDLLHLFHLANRANTSGPGARSLTRRLLVFVRWWPAIVAHHLGIIAFFWFGLLAPTRSGQGDGLIILSFCMELSSVFVAARGLLARLGLRSSRAHLWASLGMVASFLPARVLLVPAVVTLYGRQAGLGGPLQTFGSIPLKCQLGTAAFYGLNCYWFLLMLRGCGKALAGDKSHKTD